VALIAFLWALDGLPETAWKIAAFDIIVVGSVTAFVFSLDDHFADQGRRTILRGHLARSVFFVVVALASVGGLLSGLSSSASQRPIEATAYEEQLREVFQGLRKAGAEAFDTSASEDKVGSYAEDAYELGKAYGRAELILIGLEVKGRDYGLHLQLIEALGAVATAYDRLGAAVAKRSAGKASTRVAQEEVQEALKGLRRIEAALQRRGYRIRFPKA
jgi:hypothetical protein